MPPQTVPGEDERLVREREMRAAEEMRMREMEAERERERAGRSKPRTKERNDRERTKESAPPPMEERRPRASAREKERDREREREREKAEMDERELLHRRERELAWQKEAQYELMERERMEREMQDSAAVRAARAREGPGMPPPPPHFHLPHQHAGSAPPYGGPPPPPHSKSQKQPMPPLPGEVPAHYGLDRDREMKQGPPPKAPQMPPSRMDGVHPPPPPHMIQQQQQMAHQLGPGPGPGPHVRHPAEMYPHGVPMGYQSRRPSPPPFAHPLAAPPATAFMLPRAGSPAPLPIRHLGTFVFPRTPFPFLDFPAPTTSSGAPAEPYDVRATLFLPSRALPLTRPARPRVWGGALIPAVPALAGAQHAECMQRFATHPPHALQALHAQYPRYGRPWPDEVREGRRVYTDDSDWFLCALHAGWVSWSAARKARREGRDLRIEVRLTREARFVGGLGQALRSGEERGGEGVEEDLGPDDDGSTLLSSGWGNGHDGAGLEVLKAEFVPVSLLCACAYGGGSADFEILSPAPPTRTASAPVHSVCSSMPSAEETWVAPLVWRESANVYMGPRSLMA